MNINDQIFNGMSQDISKMTVKEFEEVLEMKLKSKIESDDNFRNEFMNDPGSVARNFIEREIHIKLPYNFEEKLIKGMNLYKDNKIQAISDDILEEILNETGFSINITVGFVKFDHCVN